LFFPIYFSLLIPFLPPKFPNPNPKPLDLKKGKRVTFGCGLSGSVLCCGVRTVVLVYVVIRFRAVRVCYCWNLFRFVLCYGFDSKNQLWVCWCWDVIPPFFGCFAGFFYRRGALVTKGVDLGHQGWKRVGQPVIIFGQFGH